MFIAEGQQTAAEIREQKEIDAIISHLESLGHHPVLRTMVRAASTAASVMANALSVDAMIAHRTAMGRWGTESVPLGDLLLKDPHAHLIQPIGAHLHCWEIRHHLIPSDAAAFCRRIEEGAKATLDGRRLRGMTFNWRAVKERHVRRYGPPVRFYRGDKLDSKPADYTDAESRAARLLVPTQTRNFAPSLAQLGKARSIDAAAQVGESLTRPLLDERLVRKEYLVICKQDSHTIACIQERSELDVGGGERFRCTVCGRAFRDELIQEILALTELGKRLLTGSRWMTIWVTELLISAGIGKDSVAWNPAAGEDELDIMTDALGPRVFFELKDREFGLGDAYPFAFRVSRYGGTFGVVVSTDRVAEEAKKFFQEQRPNIPGRIEFIEGEDAVESGVRALVDQFSRSGVIQLFAELAEPLAINLVPLLRLWMDKQASLVATSDSTSLTLDASGALAGSMPSCGE